MRRSASSPFAAALLATLLAASCATNPVTGKREFSLVSESQEIAMGQEGAKGAVAQMGIYADSQVQAYISTLGKAIAVHSERPNLPWSYTVVDDPVVHAFNAQYPSTIPLAQVAIINGVEAGTTLAAGRLIKRVVE